MGRHSPGKGMIKTKRSSGIVSHKNEVECCDFKVTKPVYSRSAVDNQLENTANAEEQRFSMQLRPGRQYTPVVGLSKKGLETDIKCILKSNNATGLEASNSTKSVNDQFNKNQSTCAAKAQRDCGIAQSRRKAAASSLRTSSKEQQTSQAFCISASRKSPLGHIGVPVNSQTKKKHCLKSSLKSQQPRRTQFVHWRSIQRHLPKYSRFSQVKSSRRLSLLQRNSVMSLRPGKKYVSVFAKGKKKKEEVQTDTDCWYADTKNEKENCKHKEQTAQSSQDGACTSKASCDTTDTNDTSTLLKSACRPVNGLENPLPDKYLQGDNSARYCRSITSKQRNAEPQQSVGMVLRPNKQYISVFQKTGRFNPVHPTICPQATDQSTKESSVEKSQVLASVRPTNRDGVGSWEDFDKLEDESGFVPSKSSKVKKSERRKRKWIKKKYQVNQLADNNHTLDDESGFIISQFDNDVIRCGERFETSVLSGQNTEHTAAQSREQRKQTLDVDNSVNECNSHNSVEQHDFLLPKEQKWTELDRPALASFPEEKYVTEGNQALHESGRGKRAMNANRNDTTTSQESHGSSPCHQVFRTADFAPKRLMMLRPYTTYRDVSDKPRSSSPECTQWLLIQGKNNCSDECKICLKEICIRNEANGFELAALQEDFRVNTCHKVPDETNRCQSAQTTSSVSGENETQDGVHHVTSYVQDKVHRGDTAYPSNTASQILCDYAPKTLMILRPYSQYQTIGSKVPMFPAHCNHWLLVQGQQNDLSSGSPLCQAGFDDHDNSAHMEGVNHTLGKEEVDKTSVLNHSPKDTIGSEIKWQDFSQDGSGTSHASTKPLLVGESEPFVDKRHCLEPQPCASMTANGKEGANVTAEYKEKELPLECPGTVNTEVLESKNEDLSEYAPKALMILRPYTAYRSAGKTTCQEHWLLTPTRYGSSVMLEVAQVSDEMLPSSEQKKECDENELLSECLPASCNSQRLLSGKDCKKPVNTVSNLETEGTDSAYEENCHQVDTDEGFLPGPPILELVPPPKKVCGSKHQLSDYAPKTLMILRPYTPSKSTSRSTCHKHDCGHWLFMHTRNSCSGKVTHMDDGVVSHHSSDKNKPNPHSEKTLSDKKADSFIFKSTPLHIRKDAQANTSTKTSRPMLRKRRRCRSLFARTPKQITPSKHLEQTCQLRQLISPCSVNMSRNSSHGNADVQRQLSQFEKTTNSCSTLNVADKEKESKQKRLHKVCLDIHVRGLFHWQQGTFSGDFDPKWPSDTAESMSAEKTDISEKDLSESNAAASDTVRKETAVQSADIGHCAVNPPHELPEQERKRSIHQQNETDPSQTLSGDKDEHVQDNPTSQSSANKKKNCMGRRQVHKTAIINLQRTAMKLRKKDKHFLFSRLGFKQTKRKTKPLVKADKCGSRQKTVKVHWKRRQGSLRSSESVSAKSGVLKDVCEQDGKLVSDPSKESSEQASKLQSTTSTVKANTVVTLPNDILNIILPRKRGRPKKGRQRIAKKVNPTSMQPKSKRISDKCRPSDMNLCRESTCSNSNSDKQNNVSSTDFHGLFPDKSLENCKRSSTDDLDSSHYPLPPKKRYRLEECDEKMCESLTPGDSVLSCGSVFKKSRRSSGNILSDRPGDAILSPRKSIRLTNKKISYRNSSYRGVFSRESNTPRNLQTSTDGIAVARNDVFPPHKRIRLAKYKHRLYRNSNLCIDGSGTSTKACRPKKESSRGKPKNFSQKDGRNSHPKEDCHSSCDSIKDDTIGDANCSLGTLPPRKRGRQKRSENSKPKEDACVPQSCDTVEEKSHTVGDVSPSQRSCNLPPRKQGRPNRIENSMLNEDTCVLQSCDSVAEKRHTISNVNSSLRMCSFQPRKPGGPKKSENSTMEATCVLQSCDRTEKKSHTISNVNSGLRTCSLPPRKRGRPAQFNQRSHRDSASTNVSTFCNKTIDVLSRCIVNSDETPCLEDFTSTLLKSSIEDYNKGRARKHKHRARSLPPKTSMRLSLGEDESPFLRQTRRSSYAMESAQRNKINLHQKKQDIKDVSSEIKGDRILESSSCQTRLKHQVEVSKVDRIANLVPETTEQLPLAKRIRRLIPGYTGPDTEVFTLEEFCSLETLEEAVERAAREARSEELHKSNPSVLETDSESSSSKWKSRSKRSSRSPEGSYWDCSVCTYRNKAEAFKCAMCDVRKGTSTRKPRLNAQLVAQQQAQQNLSPLIHVKSVKSTPRGPAQRKAGTTKKPRPRLKNVDRSSAISTEVVVNNVPVIITEYKEKAHTRTTTTTATTEASANRTNGTVNGL